MMDMDTTIHWACQRKRPTLRCCNQTFTFLTYLPLAVGYALIAVLLTIGVNVDALLLLEADRYYHGSANLLASVRPFWSVFAAVLAALVLFILIIGIFVGCYRRERDGSFETSMVTHPEGYGRDMFTKRCFSPIPLVLVMLTLLYIFLFISAAFYSNLNNPQNVVPCKTLERRFCVNATFPLLFGQECHYCAPLKTSCTSQNSHLCLGDTDLWKTPVACLVGSFLVLVIWILVACCITQRKVERTTDVPVVLKVNEISKPCEGLDETQRSTYEGKSTASSPLETLED